MTRRTFLLPLGLTTLGTSSQAQQSDLVQHTVDFNYVFGIFMRKLLGCSEHENDITNCRPQVGEIDYTNFRKARELAKKLFVLDEKRP